MKGLRTTRLLLVICSIFTLLLLVFSPAVAQTTSPSPTLSSTVSPSPSPTSVAVNARNTVFGLLFLTACAAGGYLTAKWIRRNKRPRPPGPWFGGGGIRHTPKE